ncbi:MAG: chitobiase/beta-hexosaminidase C-terminal domain-containing protein, partial [Kiritimatiellae bacterium]|nr:chitobiase/beta-hexosaminidase C-terminal domain-containing protein [Kiritimatiellia bacterium]
MKSQCALTALLGSVALCISAWADVSVFTAYNDLAWFSGQASSNITTCTTGASGTLVDYDTGAPAEVQLSITGGAAISTNGAQPAAGTAAYGEFGGRLDCAGCIVPGTNDLILSFTGLRPSLRYELVLYCDRAEPAYTGNSSRYHHGTLVGAPCFRNAGIDAFGVAFAQGCTLWNKLGSESEILNSEVGPDLVLYGGGTRGFHAVQHGAGVGVSSGGNKFCVCVATNDIPAILDSERGCVEAWFLQTEDPVANRYGIYRLFNGAHGLDQCSVSLALADPVYNQDPWLNGAVWFGGPWVKLGWAPGGHVRNNHPYNNVPMHTALVWDRGGIEGGVETVRLYVNGEKVDSSTVTNWGTQLSGYGDIGSGQDSQYADKCWVDDLKVWSYAKTDFGDRFNEGLSPVGVRTVAAPEDTTVYDAGCNTTNGYVTRFFDIAPGRDGRFELVVRQYTAAGFYSYANALMLRAYERVGPTWRYARGTAEVSSPVSAWRAMDFDDAGWASGPAPFGYAGAGEPEHPLGTELSDMQGGYTCLFLRRAFDAGQIEAVRSLTFHADYDDGFIAWINGVEVLRTNAPAGEPAFDATAPAGHESGDVETFALPAPYAYLVPGTNVLAVQVFNSSLGSSDLRFDLDYELDAALAPMASPSIAPAGGEFVGSVAVSMSCPEPAAIHYTLDGSTPTTNATLYAGPFDLTTSATLTARAFLAGRDPSEAVSADFVVHPAREPPSAPAAFAARADSVTAIALSWSDPCDYEEGFLLLRSADGIAYERVADFAADATGWLDTGLAAGGIYWYKLAATNRWYGSSPYAGPATARTATPLDAFTAYNDLAWFSGQRAANITAYTTTNGVPAAPGGGLLVDYATGWPVPVRLSVTGGDLAHENQGLHPAPGTDANAVFDGKVDCAGTIGYATDDLTLTLAGLDPGCRYELVLYSDRGNSAYTGTASRCHRATLDGADSFLNASSTGTVADTASVAGDTTVYNAGWNSPATAGYVTRFTGIDSGEDGCVAIRIKRDPETDGYTYANALMVRSVPAGVGKGDMWQYKRGTAEASTPASAWRARDFDDSDWAAGPAPFGYAGPGDPEHPFGTELTDMRYGYGSVFLRKRFWLDHAHAVESLVLNADYDDGFVAWLNGVEVKRVNVPAGEPSHDGLADPGHESGTYEPLPLTGPFGHLVTGANVLAVQVFNVSRESSDLKWDASLDVAWRVAQEPAIEPNGGVFTGAVAVALSTATPGATVYYTTDGTAPSSAATAYSGPFTLDAHAVVKACAARADCLPSPVAMADFRIGAGVRVFVDADAPGPAQDGRSWATAFRTLQAGIDTADDNAEVWVAAGLYVENVTVTNALSLYGGFAGTEAALEQRDWTANASVLDGSLTGSVVTITGPDTADMRVDGFTIRRGYKVGPNWYSNEQGGGGIFSDGPRMTIVNNVFVDSTGATFCRGHEHVVIQNNLATRCGMGFAIDGPPVLLANNTITGITNWAPVALFPVLGTRTVNNIIAFNKERMRTSSPHDFRNNCVYLSGTSQLDGTDAVLNIQVDPEFVDVAAGDFRLKPTSPCIDGGDSTIVAAGARDLAGNPRVMGARVDMGAYECTGTATVETPAITPNGGTFTNAVQITLQTVTPGATVFYTTDTSEPTTGSLRYTAPFALAHSAYVRARAFANGAASGLAFAKFSRLIFVNHAAPGPVQDGLSWQTAFTTVTQAMQTVVHQDEVWVAAGTYVGHVAINKQVWLLGGFAGVETERDQRDWNTNRTILDGAQQGFVVSCWGASDQGDTYEKKLIDGFTIRNGKDVQAGGILTSGPITISHNRIVDNISDRDGGGIHVERQEYSCYVRICNNLIAGNQAARHGGGLAVTHEEIAIVNNTIVSNTAAYGGAIGFYSCEHEVTIANNVIAFNSSGSSVPLGAGFMRNNCFFGNTDYDYAGGGPAPGDLFADPLFVDYAAGDFRLRPESPCVDAGFDGTVEPEWRDLAGNPRTMGGRVDMGAYERLAQQTAARPVIAPDGGAFSHAVSVALSCATPGATIFYTTDGADPATNAAVYSAPFTLAADTLLKARAYAEAYLPSPTAVAEFTFAAGPAPARPFAAYNDLAWFPGQLSANITTYTSGEGGVLVNYADGTEVSDVRFQVSGGAVGPSYETQGANGAAGTDADGVFGGIVDGKGVISYGDGAVPITLTFSNLASGLLYDVAVFCNRDQPYATPRLSRVVLSDVSSFRNTSTAGAAIGTTAVGNDTTTVDTDNTVAGYVARFEDIMPGSDGDLAVTVDSPDGHMYANAVMLRGRPIDYLWRIREDLEFEILSVPEELRPDIERMTLYLCPAGSDTNLLPTLYQNVNRHPLHIEFLREVFPDRFAGLTVEQYNTLSRYRATRQYYAGYLMRFTDPDLGAFYAFNVLSDSTQPGGPLYPAEIEYVYQRMAETVDMRPLFYAPVIESEIDNARAWSAPPVPVYFSDGVQLPDYEPYTEAVNYGRVRRLSAAQFEQALTDMTLSWQDIVVLDQAPFDLETVVAGVITAERQTELSHVNVRCARRGTPNAFVANALDEFAAYEGQLVRLEIGQTNYTVEIESDPAVAQAWWDAHRPRLSRPPPRPDWSVTNFPGLTEGEATNAPVSVLVTKYGGKTANLMAGNRHMAFEYQVAGFGIPFV